MDLSNLFSSAAKYRVLRVLSRRSSAVHLRELAEVAKVHLRSAQLAVQSLLKEKVITKHQEGNRVLFQLNRKSQSFTPLQEHFRNEEHRALQERAKAYVQSQGLLDRIHELRMLSWRVRE